MSNSNDKQYTIYQRANKMFKKLKTLFKLTYAVVKNRRMITIIKSFVDSARKILSSELIVEDILEKKNKYHGVENFEFWFEEYEESNKERKKLNICCGSKLMQGYDNTDIRSVDSSVIVFDHSKPWPIRSNSYNEVYARHCIEHFSKKEGLFLVSEIYRVLRPGGIVYIVCPNLEYITWHVNDPDSRKREIFMAFHYGWQTEPFDSRYDSHKWGYTWGTLSDLLINVGFTNVQNLTNNPMSREFRAKRWFGGIIKSGNTAHHLEVIGMKPKRD